MLARADLPGVPQSSRCSCSRLRRAARSLTQLYDAVMAPTGLRITQFALLRTIARAGSAKITELAHWLSLDRTALRRNLLPLEQKGLVRVATGRDARVREVTLSVAGREAIAGAVPYWERCQQLVAERLGKGRMAALLSVLDELEAIRAQDAVIALRRTGKVHRRLSERHKR